MIDFYNEDDRMAWVAATTFTDEAYGVAITEEELDYRMDMLEHYSDEIEKTKEIIQSIPQFSSWTFADQINFVANSIFVLNMRKEEERPKLNILL